jgi:hypothetical protein
MTFTCDICHREVPDEQGCADDMPDSCDDCWSEAHPSACCDAQVSPDAICSSCGDPAPRCGRDVAECTEDGRGECSDCEVWRERANAPAA